MPRPEVLKLIGGSADPPWTTLAVPLSHRDDPIGPSSTAECFQLQDPEEDGGEQGGAQTHGQSPQDPARHPGSLPVVAPALLLGHGGPQTTGDSAGFEKFLMSPPDLLGGPGAAPDHISRREDSVWEILAAIQVPDPGGFKATFQVPARQLPAPRLVMKPAAGAKAPESG